MSEALLRGAEMLGFTPHQAQIDLGLMLDRREETNAVLWPRRSGKSEGIWAWILGMCDLNDDFFVIVSGQTGAKSRDRFMAAARKLDRFYPREAGGPFIRRGAMPDMDFQNGSRLWNISPKPDNFRGDAAHVYLQDEAMTLDAQEGEDIKQAAMPIFDTVDEGMVILAGTAGPARGGWFWDSLELGRRMTPGYAVSEFSLADHEDPDDERLWPIMHPGLRYGLTTIEKLRARRAGMSKAQWRMEYAGQWPLNALNRALDTAAWERCAAPFRPRPEHFAIAWDLAPDNSSAAVVAAWREDDGTACVEVLREDAGTTWVPGFVAALWKAHRCLIGYDKVTGNFEPATQLANTRPPIPCYGLPLAQTAGAEARFDAMIRAGTIEHYNQAALNRAVEGASWRDLGDSGRIWGRKSSEHEVAPLVAAAVALATFDARPVAARPRIVVSQNR